MISPPIRSRELLLLLALFATVCWPLVFSGETSNFIADEVEFHLPAVRQIAAHWPALDLRKDSLSATAPGYQYALATLAQVVGTGTVPMRLANWLVSAGLVALIYVHARRRLPPIDAFLLILPLAGSNFFVKSASWVVTDNPALLLVAIALMASLQLPTNRAAATAFSLASSAGVFVRQMTIWTAGLPLASWLGRRNTDRPGTPRQLLQAILLGAPAILVLALLFHAWNGLVPPAWRDLSVRLSTAGPIYLLSVIALFGFFYLPASTLQQALAPTHRRATLLAFVGGALFSLTSETTQNHDLGRWGGYLWNLSAHLPVLAGYSVVFVLLGGAGAVALLLHWRALRAAGENHAATVLGLGLGFWAVTFVVNRQIFQRYFEPTILLLLLLAGSLIVDRTADRTGWRRRMALCGLLQLLATFITAHMAVYRWK